MGGIIMKRKLVSVLMAAMMVSTMFVGCSKESASTSGDASTTGAATETETTDSTSKDLPILGAGIYSASDNFNSYIGKAIENASKDVMQTNIEDGQNDQSTQNNEVDTMLAKGAKVIALSVVDITAAPTLIQKCKDAGNVPIIFFNKEITDQTVIGSYENAYQVTSTGGDYGASIEGQMIVDYYKAHPEMDKNGDGKLQMVDLMGDPGHTASKPRADAAKKAITDAGIGIDLLEEDTGMWDTAKAKDKMDAWISKYGDQIELILCANDGMALGALQSIEAAGFNTKGADSDKYIPVIGIDALPEMLNKIESGEVIGSVLQDAKTQGQTIVKMASNLAAGKDVMDGIELKLEDGSKAVRVPYQAITKDNLDVAESTYAE
jgi:methyl-galactoside transport system substrate-binding protein